MVENLILNSKDTEGYDAFISKYLLTQEEIVKIENGESLKTKVPTSLTNINSTHSFSVSGPCVTSTFSSEFVCYPQNGGEPIYYGTNYSGGCNGTMVYETTQIISINYGCLTGGSGGSSSNGGYNPGGGSDSGGYNPGGYWTGGGSGSSGGSQTNPNNPVLTTPNIKYPTVQRDFLLSLSDEQLDWWNAIENSTPRNEIIDYLNNNKVEGTNTVEPDAIAFALEIINSGLQGTLISAKPFFKYPPNSNYATLYPNFTSLVKDYMEYLRNDSNLIGTISDLTGQSNSIIIEQLTWGRGAEINVVQLGNAPDGTQYKGMFNPSYPDKIFIDIDLVQYLENLTNQNGENDSQVQLLNGLIVFSVCLHELVHFEDFNFDGLMQGDNDEDLGELFEAIYQGGYFEFDENDDVIFIKAN